MPDRAQRPRRLQNTGSFALILGCTLLAGCPSSVLDDYEAAREAALAIPGAPGANWKPDAVVSLSEPLLDAILAEALREGGALNDELPIRGPLGVSGKVRPDLTIDSLELSPSSGCESCLSVDAELSGSVRWTLGPAKGTVPIDAVVSLDTELGATKTAEGWEVFARPDDVREVSVDLGSGGRQIATLAEGPLKEWVQEAVKERTKPVRLTRFEADELPLRAVRILPVDSGVRVEMLTMAPGSSTAKVPSVVPASGWRLDISPDSLLALAKRASFEAGAVSHDVVVEPTGIAISHTGFEMDLRLWRVKGAGWWRDYHAEGDVEVKGARVKLTPNEVEERGKSPGAVMVDPLAALGHGVILKAIEDSLATSVPGVHRTGGARRTTEVQITEVDGTGAMIKLAGTLEFKDSGRPAVGGSKVKKKR
ncbi:MAG: hypothetical protein KC912_02545 [Proteobacteria bacterium]|nr:hypothetical protein [Pseudomonadota bacterium]